MQFQIKKIRAHELVEFLNNFCPPTEIIDPKNYLKIHQFKHALMAALPEEFEEVFFAYKKSYQEEIIKFDDQLRTARFKGQSALEEENQKIITVVHAILKPLMDRLDKHVQKYGDDILSVEVDDKGIEQVKLFFVSKKKVTSRTTKEEKEINNGAAFWLNADDYIEIATILGCFQD